jgi:hypothetical protein
MVCRWWRSGAICQVLRSFALVIIDCLNISQIYCLLSSINWKSRLLSPDVWQMFVIKWQHFGYLWVYQAYSHISSNRNYLIKDSEIKKSAISCFLSVTIWQNVGLIWRHCNHFYFNWHETLYHVNLDNYLSALSVFWWLEQMSKLHCHALLSFATIP